MTISSQQLAAERSVDLIYRAAASGAACWARNHRGHVRELPMGSAALGGDDSLLRLS
jgi:hypothetical protein